MAGIDNETIYGANVDFTGNATVNPTLISNGQMLIGSTIPNVGGTHINVGTITSTQFVVGYAPPNITIEPGASIATSYTTDSGVAMAAINNLNILGPASQEISTSGVASTITISLNPSIRLQPGQVFNVGVNYAASTFTVRGASASLSSTNPAYVCIQSKTFGNNVVITLTADQTFVDDSGSSTIAGNLFGFDVGNTTAVDIPFFLYAVLNDAENAISWMISRIPGVNFAPAAADIGKTGSAVADNQWSFFALGNPTVADYEGNPCVLVGSFRMRLTTSPGDWTVQALAATDGIANFNEQTLFTWPTAVMGAATNSHFTANGGTAPAWATASNYEYVYRVTKEGMVFTNFTITGDPSTDGVGAVNLTGTLPFRSPYTKISPSGGGFYNRTAINLSNLWPEILVNANTMNFVITNPAGSAVLTNANVTAAVFETWILSMQYSIKKNA